MQLFSTWFSHLQPLLGVGGLQNEEETPKRDNLSSVIHLLNYGVDSNRTIISPNGLVTSIPVPASHFSNEKLFGVTPGL